jgi:hypothetical protein
MSTSSADKQTAIREQAYYFWEQDGRPHGREHEYWMRATVAVADRDQMGTLTEAPPRKTGKPKDSAGMAKAGLAANKAKAPPAKSAKPDPKASPKKK